MMVVNNTIGIDVLSFPNTSDSADIIDEETTPYFVMKGLSSYASLRRHIIILRTMVLVLSLLFAAIILVNKVWDVGHSIVLLALPCLVILFLFSEFSEVPKWKSARPLKVSCDNLRNNGGFLIVNKKKIIDIRAIDHIDIVRGKGQQVIKKGTGTWWTNAPSRIVIHKKNSKKIDLGHKHPLFAIEFKKAMTGLGIRTEIIGSGDGEFSRYEDGKLLERTDV
jgi:membrane protein YdbS with pleckstrin-like domain